MQLPVSILCFGSDPTLVRTRQQIFQRAGFITRIAESKQELSRCFAQYAFNILVICHSVSTEECDAAKQLAHSQKALTLVLVLDRGAHTCNADAKDAMFQTTLGPEALLRAISQLLGNRSEEPMTLASAHIS